MWSGQWTADLLGVQVRDGGGPVPLPDLVGMALRINPKRPQLLVSTALAKHIPTDPRLVGAAGHLLGAHAALALGLLADPPGAATEEDASAALAAADAALSAALSALAHDEEPDAAALMALESAVARVLALLQAPAAGVVFGYAETATALGHLVGAALGMPVVHSTRRAVRGTRSALEFDEVHSHATRHRVLAEADLLQAVGPDGVAGPVVLVDDELTTGKTVLATIEALHQLAPHDHYVVATLVDARRDADRARIAAAAADLGVRIDVVALGVGVVDVPDDAQAPPAPELTIRAVTSSAGPEVAPEVAPDPGDGWPLEVPVTARHGFMPAHEQPLADAAADLARRLQGTLSTGPASGDVLVLGTEELMYAPLAVAAALRAQGVPTFFSTTTRSPVQVRDVDGYAIRSGIRFVAHDRDADGYGVADRFAYNVAAREWSAIVVVLDRPAATAALHGPEGLLSVLRGYAPRVLPVVLPSTPPGPEPLRGPDFGSYAADEVGWLLQDLSSVALEGDRESREAAIQSGAAHYAESLPTEYRPDDAYRELYAEQLTAVADRVAAAVVTVADLSRRVRGRDDLVLVSLARAGTPIGILMRRWAARTGWDWPHYALSIVRDRGIDGTAMRWLADRYDPDRILVVDGWTGKGAIAREFGEAIATTNAQLRLPEPGRGGFGGDVAVLADPGECVELFGTRDDFLIPSACLNSTVSGLVSRTVLNTELIGSDEFHGAKFYAELRDEDVSGEYLDAIAAAFDGVESAALAEAERLVEADRTPTWSGWAAAEKLQADLGLRSINLVKPGVGETTRVLLRRVPWQIAVRPGRDADLRHVRLLAADRGVPVVEVPDLPYSCVGIIRPTEQDGS